MRQAEGLISNNEYYYLWQIMTRVLLAALHRDAGAMRKTLEDEIKFAAANRAALAEAIMQHLEDEE